MTAAGRGGTIPAGDGLARAVIDVPLSVLDLAPVAAGASAGEALRHTTELARRTEELGYRRFWVAEHHNMPAIASSAPAVLLAHLAAHTSHDPAGLRRGDAAQPRAAGGGRAVRHPGGAAPGPDRPGHRARAGHRPGDRAGAAPDDGGAVGRGLPAGAGGPDELLQRRASRGRSPPPRAAASSRRSGCSAPAGSAPSWPACSGCRSPSRTTSARRTRCPRWRCTGSSFRPSRWLDKPYAMVAVNAVCAETDERARVAGRAERGCRSCELRSGRPEPLATPGGGGGVPVHRDRARVRRGSAGRGRRSGSPETVRRQLERPAGAHRRGRADAHHAGVRRRRTGCARSS